MRRAVLHAMRFVAAWTLATTWSPPAHAGAGPWEFVRSDDGIVVHRRKVDGFDLHEFRGRGVIDAPLPRVLGVLGDAARRVEWMERCVESWEIEKIGETGQIAYNRTKGTWPVSDRDVVVRGGTTFDLERREVRATFENARHAKVPPKDGVVRLNYLRGHWILRPYDGGKHTWVEYQAHADPAGSLPSFVVNMVSKTLPYKTILQLRRQVKRAQYPEVEQRLLANPRFLEIMTGKKVETPDPGSGTPVGSKDPSKGAAAPN